ncbi:universal stress protein [Thermodesulfobacteriota bacterium]
MTLPKVEIKKILYATDLSEGARYAFAYAVSLANTYNAAITILHVLFEIQNLDWMMAAHIGHEDWLKIKERTYNEAREALINKKRENIAIEEVLHKFSKNAKAENESLSFITDEIIIKNGNPEDHILEQADLRNCDIIVMGSHGQGALADAVIGSTARRVVRRSQKPVFVVPLPKKG